MLVFVEGGKPKNPGTSHPPGAKLEPTTNSAYILYGTGPESNPGHIGGRRVPSLLGPPCFPKCSHHSLTTRESLSFPSRFCKDLHLYMYDFFLRKARTCSSGSPQILVACITKWLISFSNEFFVLVSQYFVRNKIVARIIECTLQNHCCIVYRFLQNIKNLPKRKDLLFSLLKNLLF